MISPVIELVKDETEHKQRQSDCVNEEIRR